eukprot:CAMPEP_0174917754 /NCGR_PEP_ID=MMETSP1355-20121228/2662_1 /TAXON_ID=464990 /ORGANISM="Hemiselmis tepida, Strain CCMP443" /LENGTH=296 /DNA_ID=CAMNT_0016162881 /DNA_START=107 /DNA_END=993 /DNA_ORIENTATION=-
MRVPSAALVSMVLLPVWFAGASRVSKPSYRFCSSAPGPAAGVERGGLWRGVARSGSPSPFRPGTRGRAFMFSKEGGGTAMLVEEEVFVCLDCETTGLDVEGEDRIVEVAARKFSLDTPSISEHFHSLVNPGRPIPNSNLHGIRDTHVSEKPPASAVLPRLFAFVGNHTVVGHGVAFDLMALAHEARRCGAPLPLDASNHIDTRRLSMHYGAGNLSLAAMREHFDTGDINSARAKSHIAADDVDACVEVFSGLARGFATSREIFDVLSRPVRARSLPFGKHHGVPLRDVPTQYLEWL